MVKGTLYCPASALLWVLVPRLRGPVSTEGENVTNGIVFTATTEEIGAAGSGESSWTLDWPLRDCETRGDFFTVLRRVVNRLPVAGRATGVVETVADPMLEGGRLLFINGTALSRLTVLRVGHMAVKLLIRKGPRSFSSGISFRLRDVRRGVVAVSLSRVAVGLCTLRLPSLDNGVDIARGEEGEPLIYFSFIPSLLDGASSFPQRVLPTSHAQRKTHATSTFFGFLSVPWGRGVGQTQ
ncbi:trans-sialidase, putative [Trypanosoma cruzi marinkellei]|uniref:Trans-sialidase, putative n=1 Tax=Trypanosoma cruzi marinkellei TaxID=85056 RepID=K2MV79_TRYCR|nr:trans-sialidase, putative [Trypanosoma cruzi marinkellei]